MTTEWIPTGHRPPLPRIETAPNYTPPPAQTVQQLSDEIEHEESRIKEGERVWQQVVETARST